MGRARGTHTFNISIRCKSVILNGQFSECGSGPGKVRVVVCSRAGYKSELAVTRGFFSSDGTSVTVKLAFNVTTVTVQMYLI